MRKYITIPNSPVPQRADASGAPIGGRGPLAQRAGGPRENGEGPDGAGLSEMDRRQREIYNKQQQLLRDQRTADQEKLLLSISGTPCPRPAPATLRSTDALLDHWRRVKFVKPASCAVVDEVYLLRHVRLHNAGAWFPLE